MKPRTILFIMAAALIMCGAYALRAVNPPAPAQPELPANVTLLNENMRRIDSGRRKHTLIYQNNQNYMKDGVAYPFDLSIRNSQVSSFDYEVENKVRLLLNGSSDGGYRIEHEGDYAEFELANIASPVSGTNAEGMLRFNNVFPYTDIIQQPVNLGLKETVVLKNDGASLSMATLMRTNLSPEPNPDGSIFLTRNGAPVFRMPAPSAVDANGVLFAAAYTLAPSGNDYFITLSVDTDSAGVAPAYPVNIDPTITFNNPSNIKDAFFIGYPGDTNKNWGAAQYFSIGFYHGGGYDDKDRGVLEFSDVDGSIPSGATIDEAALKLYCHDHTLAGSSYNLQLFRITKDWDEGTQTGGVGNCCWDLAKTGVAWDSGGGSYAEQVDTTTHRGTTGWYSFDVKETVQKWVSGTANNYGFLIRDSIETSSNNGDNNRHYFRSSDYTGSEKPELVVTYTSSDTFTFAIPTGRVVDLNDTIRVPVYVVNGFSASDSVVAVDFSVVYMPELLKVIDVDTVGALLGGAPYFEAKDTVGICRVSATKSSGFSGSNDTLAFLEFAATNVSYADTNGTDLVIVEQFLGGKPFSNPTHFETANQNGDLTVIKILYGDVNLGGSITPYDASMLLRYLVGDTIIGGMQYLAGEVSGDSCLTSLDAQLILQKYVGNIDSFPVGDTLFVN